jgi:hypothetical protein
VNGSVENIGARRLQTVVAVNEISSITRSSTVCSRRAPIFSTEPFTSTATRASASMASSVKFSKPSDLLPELQGRLPIRVELQPLTVEDFKQILTATEACLVATVVPSIRGSRSRCTPSRETSAPERPSRAQILSISSRKTHILFIASGAFHVSKPSDLLPELQGRLPIRVELQPLTVEDFKQILHRTVHLDGDAGERVDGVLGEVEGDAFRLHQRQPWRPSTGR